MFSKKTYIKAHAFVRLLLVANLHLPGLFFVKTKQI